MKIKKYQSYVDLAIANWGDTSFADKLFEIVKFQKQYENDHVEVQQVVELGKFDDEWRYVIILNISRDLDNLGDKMIW